MFSFMITSADGYHADPGQALDWQTIDEEFSQFALTQLREAGTLVFGRVTYELMAAFWPTPAGQESDPDVAKAMNTTPKIVISRTLAQAGWAGTQVISHHAEEELARLKQQPGKDIVIAGSSTLTAGLLQAGLLDELRILVSPVIRPGRRPRPVCRDDGNYADNLPGRVHSDDAGSHTRCGLLSCYGELGRTGSLSASSVSVPPDR